MALVQSFATCVLAEDHEAPLPKEYKIKAAYVFNFTKFVEWPAERFSPSDAPYEIGVLSSLPIVSEIERIAIGKLPNGRPVQVTAVRSREDVSGIHLLYVTRESEDRLAVLRSLLGEDCGVLTIGESTDFASSGGIITFARVGENVRFAISAEAARKAGLKVSSKLLRLGIDLQGKGKAAP